PVLIEVNMAGEVTKSGIDPSHLQTFIEDLAGYERLRLSGLMTIPPFFDNPEHVRPYFRKLREVSERFNLPELSMGMSQEFEVVIIGGERSRHKIVEIVGLKNGDLERKLAQLIR